MAGRTRTLAELVADVQFQADQQAATARHPASNIKRCINQAIAEFREIISDAGHPYYLVKTTGSLTTGPTSPHPYQIMSIAAITPAVLRIYGFDIKVSSEWRTLPPVNFDQRNDYQGGVCSTDRGIPIAWFIYDTSNIAIVPGPDQTYSYALWYLPVHTDLTLDADTFDGMAGWEEWVVYCAACKLLLRDASEAQLQMMAGERQRLLQSVLARCTQQQRAGATRRHDVRGRSRWQASIAKRRGWGQST